MVPGELTEVSSNPTWKTRKAFSIEAAMRSELRSEGTVGVHCPREGGKVSVPQMQDATCALTPQQEGKWGDSATQPHSLQTRIWVFWAISPFFYG